MKKNIVKIPAFFCTTTTLLVSSTLHAAGVSPLNMSLSSGVGSNIIATYAGQTTIVEYRLQDVIGRAPARTWTWEAPVPAYITRAQSLHQPDCAVYNQQGSNPGSFALPPDGVCYFAFQVNGTQFAAQTSAAKYRPLFTNSGGIAYGPCESEEVQITLTQAPPPPPPQQNPIAIAAGLYADMNDTARPLLVTSQNLGATWTYPGSIPEVTFTPSTNYRFVGQGEFKAASCSGTTCIAAGLGEDYDGLTTTWIRPLIAVSQDSGVTWTYPESAITPMLTTHPFLDYGKLFGASCNGHTCIAGGSYYDALPLTNPKPLLAVSQDSGMTWDYPDSVTTPTFLLNPFSSGTLRGASCSDSTCVAAGRYEDTTTIVRPMLVVRNQSTSNLWVYPEDVTTPQFTPTAANPVVYPFVSGEFLSTNCSGNTCIATGSYDDGMVHRPLLAVSHDAGNNWDYPNSIPDPVGLTTYPFNRSGTLNSGSCSGNTCIAVGLYDDGLYNQSMLAVSQDSGSTWNYVDSVTTSVNSNYSNLLATSCSGNVCIASGYYIDGMKPYMFLVSSQDSGTTWTFQSSLATNKGSLTSASCLANYCIAAGNYELGVVTRPIVVFSVDSGLTWNIPESVKIPQFSPALVNPEHDFYRNGAFNGAGTASGSNSLLPDSLKFINQTTKQPQQHYISRPSA